jgi:hypothetical protein
VTLPTLSVVTEGICHALEQHGGGEVTTLGTGYLLLVWIGVLRGSSSVADNHDDLHGILPGFRLVRSRLCRLPGRFTVRE